MRERGLTLSQSWLSQCGGAVPLSTGVDGQRLVLRRALVLRDHAAVPGLTVHVTHRPPLATRPRALQGQEGKGQSAWFTGSSGVLSCVRPAAQSNM